MQCHPLCQSIRLSRVQDMPARRQSKPSSHHHLHLPVFSLQLKRQCPAMVMQMTTVSSAALKLQHSHGGRYNYPVQQGVEESASYHSKVRTAQGHGLLIDPGSYGNLVGDAWVEDLQSTLLSHDHSVQLINREKPMHVGGVGKGCQTCTQDVVFPLALQRSDGTMNLGDFTPATAGRRHC